jgi:hypothetical protein
MDNLRAEAEKLGLIKAGDAIGVLSEGANVDEPAKFTRQ